MQAIAGIFAWAWFLLTLLCLSTFFQRTRIFAARRGFRFRRVRYVSGAGALAALIITGAVASPPTAPPSSSPERPAAVPANPTAAPPFTPPTAEQAKNAYELYCEARKGIEAEIAAKHLDLAPDPCRTHLNGKEYDPIGCQRARQQDTELHEKYFGPRGEDHQIAVQLGISDEQAAAASGLGIAMAVEHKLPRCPADVNVAPIEQADVVDVQDILNAYHDNEVAADEQYKGKLLDLLGSVDRVARDFSGASYVTLDPWSDRGGSLTKLQLYFSETPELEQDLADLRNGESIHVICRCEGKLMFSIVMKDCRTP